MLLEQRLTENESFIADRRMTRKEGEKPDEKAEVARSETPNPSKIGINFGNS